MKYTSLLVGSFLTISQTAAADHYCDKLKVFNEVETGKAVVVFQNGPNKLFTGQYTESTSGLGLNNTHVSSYKLIGTDKATAELIVTANFECNRATCDLEKPYKKVAKLKTQGVTHVLTCPTLHN